METEMPALHVCPACFDGAVWDPCPACNGDGARFLPHDKAAGIQKREDPCAVCDGGGEVRRPTPCELCDGKGQLPAPLVVLWDADHYCSRQDPDWNGDPFQHEGATIYSTAAYFRRRDELRQKVRRVAARLDPTKNTFGCVWFYDKSDNQLFVAPGFAWGYTGSGPTGLATVLADLWPQRWPKISAARRFVARMPQDTEWEVTI